MITTEFAKGLQQESTQIRQEVFVDEQGFQEEFDDIDSVALHVIVRENGTAIGTGRTYLKEGTADTYYAGRIAVVKSHRKQGIGSVIMEALEATAKEQGGKVMELSAQLQASGFYSSIGYEAFGDVYYDQHRKHIAMKKTL